MTHHSINNKSPSFTPKLLSLAMASIFSLSSFAQEAPTNEDEEEVEVLERDLAKLGELKVSPKGVFYDFIVIEGATIVVCLLWPLIIAFLITFGPLHLSHRHFKRKKEFIAKLKGEHTENA